MDIKKLFSGVAVIIDDKINKRDSGDKIIIIRDKLKKNNIPILEYEDIPENPEIKNFNNISFVLLDWELFERPEPGLQMDETPFINNNIKFLRKISKTSFLPIFIFSNISPDSIIRTLSDNGIYEESFNNYIFVKRKDELFSSNGSFLFFSLLKKWLKKTPSMYVLKEWEQSLNKAKRDLFWLFYAINPNWPATLQETFKADGSDVNYELGSFIFKNIIARTEPIKFDDKIIKQKDIEISKDDIRKILESERFIQKDSLPSEIPYTGDLFKIYKYELSENATSKKELLYLNIRPECDIARANNPEIYCIECEIIDEKKITVLDNESKNVDFNRILFKNGSFIDKTDNTYLPFVFDSKILVVKFKDLKMFKWKQELYSINKTGNKRVLKDARIGRILPPYITKIQQKFAFYLQRKGLPAIPEKAIK